MIFQPPLLHESIKDSRFQTRQEAGLLQAEANERMAMTSGGMSLGVVNAD